ncbi:hypothetical protein DPMN_055170 [Dreissena polymorpha]|uniref:Uncharacterized protein n=1 Tax=Dreissena polymorpha TaxID=45954 RepID=A0A9D4HS06_DREPO|nr:hypothetical protein DPMN_085944 [Dreissena polymorpha]KAH3729204.1 hypothetical protein DPMN_055170 [Dreissena polymorpha]
MQSTPAARHEQPRVSHFPVHLHNISKLRGKGFRHFVGNSMPRCSSHPPCLTGASRVSGPSLFIGSLHALCRKAPLRICP